VLPAPSAQSASIPASSLVVSDTPHDKEDAESRRWCEKCECLIVRELDEFVGVPESAANQDERTERQDSQAELQQPFPQRDATSGRGTNTGSVSSSATTITINPTVVRGT
jgi:hypothetical protein